MKFHDKLARALAEENVDIFDIDAADDHGCSRFMAGDWVRCAVGGWRDTFVGYVLRAADYRGDIQVWLGAIKNDNPLIWGKGEDQLSHIAAGDILADELGERPRPAENQRNALIRGAGYRPGAWVKVNGRYGMCTSIGAPYNRDRVEVWFGETALGIIPGRGTVPRVVLVPGMCVEVIKNGP